jgi:putative flippase GtrA
MPDLAVADLSPGLRAEDQRQRLHLSRRFIMDLVRYGFCSGLALAIDWGLLVGLVKFGVGALPAAAIGFVAGMMVTYFGSILFVFSDRRRRGLFAETIGFFVIGIAGLVGNEILLWGFVNGLGLHVAIAKAPTAVLIFLFNFLLRRSLVFAGST